MIDFTTFEYSTSTEKIIGKWIDGSTLYRKVFTSTITVAANTADYPSVTVTSATKIIDIGGYWTYNSSGSGSTKTFGSGDVSANGTVYVWFMYITSNTINIETKSPFARSSAQNIMIVDYIK